MPPPLDGVRAKIYRAKYLFNDLNTRVGRILGLEPKTAPSGHKFDADRQELIITLPKTTRIDPELPLLVGDCIHNARSALDHLVFQLAILNKASVASASKTSFPVCLTPGEFKNAVRHKVAPFISAMALAEIEKLQPYATKDGESDIIWVLSQLDIIDKHRLLIVTASRFKPTGFSIKVPTGEKFSHEINSVNWKPSEDGAEVLRFDLSNAIKKPGEVNVKVETSISIHISNTGLACDGMAICPVVGDCIQHVINIVDGFERAFFARG